eukprot:m.55126 g.55126  ORF g.55126 m.55126 type:complete len:70 (+) comp10967_c1_seq1:173-382(+)
MTKQCRRKSLRPTKTPSKGDYKLGAVKVKDAIRLMWERAGVTNVSEPGGMCGILFRLFQINLSQKYITF